MTRYFLIFMLLAAGVQSSAGALPLNSVQDRATLGQFLSDACQINRHQGRLFARALMPERTLIAEDDEIKACGALADFPKERKSFNEKPSDISGVPDMDWFYRLYRLTQEKQSAYVSKVFALSDPRDISFMHRAFATRPYITARVMAAAPQPLVGRNWRNLYGHLDKALSSTGVLEDKRMLVQAQFRDGRDQAAMENLASLIDDEGDRLSLPLLENIRMDRPKDIVGKDENADQTEPEMSYWVVLRLEKYLYRQNYPATFCDWYASLKKGLLKDYTRMVLLNFEDSIRCDAPKNLAS